MRSGDVALRLSAVFAVAGFIIMAAGVYEIDRREKSSSETVTANVREIEQRVRILNEQFRILSDQYATQIATFSVIIRVCSAGAEVPPAEIFINLNPIRGCGSNASRAPSAAAVRQEPSICAFLATD